MNCKCGVYVKEEDFAEHLESEVHVNWANDPAIQFAAAETELPEAEVEKPNVPMDDTLKAVLAEMESPIGTVEARSAVVAKLARRQWGIRGWPNEAQPVTVREWLESNGIPLFDSTILERGGSGNGTVKVEDNIVDQYGRPVPV